MFSLIRTLFHVVMLAWALEALRHGDVLSALGIAAGYGAVCWRELREAWWIAQDRWVMISDWWRWS